MAHRNAVATQIIAGLAQSDGGPSYSIPALSAALNGEGVRIRLRFLGDGRDAPEAIAKLGDFATAHPADRGLARMLRGSRSLYAALGQDARQGTLLHVHGLWLLPNLYPAWIKRHMPSTRLVHSPRGMLAPAAMQISGWKKKPVWHLWQKSALQNADCLHATAMSEYDEIRALGFVNPVAVIPNGIDLPDGRPNEMRDGRHRTILALGRIHPKKALDVLVRAWAFLEKDHPDWQVRIVGPSEGGYAAYLENLARRLGLERLTVEGPVYGQDKLATYRSAALFVLPTRNENFGIAIAEALASQVPVISTKGAPWSGLEAERCGWWIDHGIESLTSALKMALQTDRSELAQMGQRGREWMERDFSWRRVATEMSAVYDWLRKEGPLPSCVRVD